MSDTSLGFPCGRAYCNGFVYDVCERKTCEYVSEDGDGPIGEGEGEGEADVDGMDVEGVDEVAT